MALRYTLLAFLAAAALALLPPALAQTSQVVGWGSTASGVLTLPPALGDVAQVAAGTAHAVALRRDGTVAAWGTGADGETAVPAGLSGVLQVAAGERTSYALRANRTVAGWGLYPPPAGLADVAQVSANGTLALALRRDGSVAAWGQAAFGQLDVPAGLTDVVQVAACPSFGAALRRTGAVVTWGAFAPAVPAALTGVVQIDCGIGAVLALRGDLTVTAFGSGPLTDVPFELTTPSFASAFVVSASRQHALALLGDGTVVAWGADTAGETTVPTGLRGAFRVEAGDRFSLAVRETPTTEVQLTHDSAALAAFGPIRFFLNGAATPAATVSFGGASARVVVPAQQALQVRAEFVTPPPPGLPASVTFTAPALPTGAFVVSLAGIPAALLPNYQTSPTGTEQSLGLLLAALRTFAPRGAEAVPFVVTNAITDAPALDVVIVETGQVLADDLLFRQSTFGALVAPGTYTVETRRADTGALVASSRLTFDAGGESAAVRLSGFLTPSANQNGPAAAIRSADASGTTQGGPTAGEAAPAGGGLALAVASPARGLGAVRYTLAGAGPARLVVVDLLGREVAVLADGVQAAGAHTATLDAGGLAPGAYVLRLSAGPDAVTRLVTVVR